MGRTDCQSYWVRLYREPRIEQYAGRDESKREKTRYTQGFPGCLVNRLLARIDLETVCRFLFVIYFLINIRLLGSRSMSLLAARMVAANRMANLRSSVISSVYTSVCISPPGMARPFANSGYER